MENVPRDSFKVRLNDTGDSLNILEPRGFRMSSRLDSHWGNWPERFPGAELADKRTTGLARFWLAKLPNEVAGSWSGIGAWARSQGYRPAFKEEALSLLAGAPGLLTKYHYVLVFGETIFTQRSMRDMLEDIGDRFAVIMFRESDEIRMTCYNVIHLQADACKFWSLLIEEQ